MKRIIIIMIGTLAVLSCKKNPVVTPPPPHKNTFSAQVNGKAFVPLTISAYVDHYHPDYLFIMAIDANDRELGLTISNYDSVKTSFILNDYPHTHGFFTPQGFVYSDSKSGQFNIDLFDKTTYKPEEVITGTFQFETDDAGGKYSITDGQFSILVKHQ